MNPYKAITQEDLAFFEHIMESERVLRFENELTPFGSDYTEDLLFMPEAVLIPKDVFEVAEIFKYCNEKRIPITPRGAGTGLSGGALPVCKGLILSTKLFNKILNIDENNMQATVEPGVINEVFQEAVKSKNLFYPPDPASKGSCFLGGNVAENSGGPKALKYGVTKDYVLNLEIVLPTGEIIWTGANTLKNSTGYNLTQLIVGSEGTLAFVSKIVFKLLPLPKESLLMMACFSNLSKSCEAVSAILMNGLNPSALEFMERNAIEWSMKFADIQLQIREDTEAILLVEVDGNDLELLYDSCDKINGLLEQYGSTEVLMAENAAEKEKLWKMRRVCGEAVHAHSTYKEEDTVVPRYHLPQLLKAVKEIGYKYGFESVCYGHAGDGNLHVNILKGELSEEQWNNTVKEGIRELFEVCKALGGTISGEHGIGWVQKEYMDIMFSQVHLNLMREIKKVFDPINILNPSKIF